MSKNTVGHPVPKGLSNGCHCAQCKREHADRQQRYREGAKAKDAKLKLELSALREFYAITEAAQLALTEKLAS